MPVVIDLSRQLGVDQLLDRLIQQAAKQLLADSALDTNNPTRKEKTGGVGPGRPVVVAE